MPSTPVTWLDQFTINLTQTNAQFGPDVAQLANGNMLVSWTTSDPGGLGSPNGNEAFAQLIDPLGNLVGGEFRLNNASAGGDEQNADVAALPNGGFIVAYHDLDNPASVPFGGSNIRVEEYDAAGNQVTENAAVVLDSGVGADPNYRNPRIAVSSATSAMIVYEEFTASGTKIVGKIYNPETDAYGNQLTLINASGSIDAAPDVAVLSNGNYVIASSYNFGGDNAINYTIISATGGGVKGPTFVSDTSTNGLNDREASVAALAGGGFVIAWTNTDANDTDILFRVFDSAGTQISSGSPGDDGAANNNNEAKVITLAGGAFVIAWDNDGTAGVNVQHYSATGGLLGSVLTVSADNADSISGVGLGDGRFALVWDVSGGEVSMEILDTRDSPNETGVYAPDQWQVGTPGGDQFDAKAATEFTHGGAGNDIITEAVTAGIQRYFGDGGNDKIVVLSAIDEDIFNGGGGRDTIDWSNSGVDGGVNFNLATGVAKFNGESESIRRFENLVGTDFADRVTGSGGDNSLRGGGGGDNLLGADGNDRLDGGKGGDRLTGGDGTDRMSGGSGGDRFVFRVANSGNDTVTDFDGSEGDVLQIDASAFGGGLVAGSLASNRLVIGGGPTRAFGQFLYDTKTGQLRWDTDGAGGDAAIDVAILADGGAASLAAADFDIVA